MAELRVEDLHPDPVRQFERWFHDAVEAKHLLPEGMTLATADRNGQPSARVVLLKGFDEHGFVFFTNYRSRKCRDLEENPRAALCFWWPLVARQVRIEGTTAPTSAAESDAYFATRPRGSQIGAWASDQSSTIGDRAILEERAEEIARRWEGQPIPRPAHWGGWRLVPEAFEFWENRDDRLHDRFRYTRVPDGWLIDRLAP
ncbi:MAG: pyridoxamine 5'-phosphate oxidase [Thermoanaerobaculia bacterium]